MRGCARLSDWQPPPCPQGPPLHREADRGRSPNPDTCSHCAMRAWLLTLLPILEGPEENFHLVGKHKSETLY